MLDTIVLLVWNDAHAGDNETWTPIEDIEDGGYYVVQSVGWLVPDAKAGHVTIAQSLTPDDQIDHLLHVPSGMVNRMTVLNCKTIV
jgi:hypothetical protein